VLASSVTQCAGDESLACADSTQSSLYNQVKVLLLELELAGELVPNPIINPNSFAVVVGVFLLQQVFNGIGALKNAHVNYFYDSLGACDAQTSDPTCTVLA
jgi:hypothetical protein